MNLINVHENEDGVLVGECPNCHADHCIDSYEDVELDDPVAEARQIIAELVERFIPEGLADHERIGRARNWLDRNGGAK